MSDAVHPSNNSEELLAESKSFGREFDALLPALAAARRTYMRAGSEADRIEMERLESLGADLALRHGPLYDRLKAASGLPVEVLEAIDRPQVQLDSKSRMRRENLQINEVETTGFMDRHLAGAVEKVERLLPAGWADEQSEVPHRLCALFNGTECLADGALWVGSEPLRLSRVSRGCTRRDRGPARRRLSFGNEGRVASLRIYSHTDFVSDPPIPKSYQRWPAGPHRKHRTALCGRLLRWHARRRFPGHRIHQLSARCACRLAREIPRSALQQLSRIQYRDTPAAKLGGGHKAVSQRTATRIENCRRQSQS